MLSLDRQERQNEQAKRVSKIIDISFGKECSCALYPWDSELFCLTEESGSSASLLGGALTWSQAQSSVKSQLCLWPGYVLLPVYALEWQTLEKYSQGLTDYTWLQVTRG